MKNATKYASIPDEYREHVLRVLRKPASKRTELERQTIEVANKVIAVTAETAELVRKTEEQKRKKEELKRRTEELERETDGVFAEIGAEAHRLWTVWEPIAREELVKIGFDVDGKDLHALQYGLVSSGANDSPAGRLIGALWLARQSERKQSPELGFMSGLSMASALVKMGRSKLLDSALSVIQSKRSKRPRRPRFPTKRVIRCALANGRTTASEVEAYLENNEEVCDEWGLMQITDNGVCFTVEDLDGPKNEHGEYPEGKVYKDRLPVLVSQVKSEK